MTVEDRATIKAIILPAEAANSISRAGQLLIDAGHDVSSAQSADQAMDMLQHDDADLLVVDVTNSPKNHDFVSQLSSLNSDYLPREVAIFSDSMDEVLRGLRERLSPSKVHIFLKPLHMHGLLSVLRHLECPE
jgi:two-component SAPR family response regulator